MQPEKFSEDEFMTEKWRCFKKELLQAKKKYHSKGSFGTIS